MTAESDGTTATFRYDSVVAATESIEFPEATFEVTPSAPGRVVITFSGYEQSITFDVDGDRQGRPDHLHIEVRHTRRVVRRNLIARTSSGEDALGGGDDDRRRSACRADG